jgi:predicted naringenin-chalcone synthase
MKTTTILSLATATPPHTVAQADAAAMAEQRCCRDPSQRRLLHTLYRQTTVRHRASVLLHSNGGSHPAPTASAPAHRDDAPQPFLAPPSEPHDRGPTIDQRMQQYALHALPLAARAASSAIDHANLRPCDITQLVTVSCTGFAAPGLDIRLISELHLPPTVGRTMVGFMGCHGAINGLRVASALAHADPQAHVLLCAVELCSLHFHYGWNPQQIVANALFADGAAALIATANPSAPSANTSPAATSSARSTLGPWSLLDTASCLLPDSQDAMTWTIRDHGFEMTLSPRVPSLIETHLRPFLLHWLSSHNLTLTDIPSWAIHPGGPRVIAAVEHCLNLPPHAADPSRQILADHGNMSSPTILFILDSLRRASAPTPCVALAFGPGLVVEAALFI